MVVGGKLISNYYHGTVTELNLIIFIGVELPL